MDFPSAFAFARETGGPACGRSRYGERAAMLGDIAKMLQANRDAYFEISVANSGTTRIDSAIDVDGEHLHVGPVRALGCGAGRRARLGRGRAQAISRRTACFNR